MTNDTASFEEALKSLEETVAQLEAGELNLEQSLDLFEQGVASANRCQTLLGEAENQVELLLKTRDGSLTAEPFVLEKNDES